MAPKTVGKIKPERRVEPEVPTRAALAEERIHMNREFRSGRLVEFLPVKQAEVNACGPVAAPPDPLQETRAAG